MFTRQELKRETVITRRGEEVTIMLNVKTRNSTGRTVYEVLTSHNGSVDAVKLPTAEKNFAKCVNHFRKVY